MGQSQLLGTEAGDYDNMTCLYQSCRWWLEFEVEKV